MNVRITACMNKCVILKYIIYYFWLIDTQQLFYKLTVYIQIHTNTVINLVSIYI